MRLAPSQPVLAPPKKWWAYHDYCGYVRPTSLWPILPGHSGFLPECPVTTGGALIWSCQLIQASSSILGSKWKQFLRHWQRHGVEAGSRLPKKLCAAMAEQGSRSLKLSKNTALTSICWPPIFSPLTAKVGACCFVSREIREKLFWTAVLLSSWLARDQ